MPLASGNAALAPGLPEPVLRRTGCHGILLLIAVTCQGLAQVAIAAEALAGFARVEVAPTKTSIYLGSVTMTMPAFRRAGAAYESTYTAKVFPFFFYNETGRLTVNLPDDALHALQRGEAIDFTGRAVNTAGAERKVTGRATPVDASSGKLKVRVQYSKRIELIFNTSYRFTGAEDG